MSNGLAGAFKARPWPWRELFWLGTAGLVVAFYKGWQGSPPPAYYPMPQPAAPPVQSPVVATPAPAPKVLRPPPAISPVQTVAPASSFTPSRIAPEDMPEELRHLGRPPPDPPPRAVLPEVQPGYTPPVGPEPRDIR